MDTLRISFDVDGVLALFKWKPFERREEWFMECPLEAGMDVKLFNDLLFRHEVFIVTSRSIPNSGAITRRWLEANGVEEDALAGMITHINPWFKAGLVNCMGMDLHIDDDPRAVDPLGMRGVLYINPDQEGNTELAERWQPNVVASMKEIYDLIKYRGGLVEARSPVESLCVQDVQLLRDGLASSDPTSPDAGQCGGICVPQMRESVCP